VVSAVVLNFNGGSLVLGALASLEAQDPPLAEIICVDNASHDGSPDVIAERFPGVRLVRLERNTGFTGGMNRGIREATGEFVLLVNLDLTLDPSYAARCAAALAEDERLGGVTGKLLRPGSAVPPIIDTTGHVVYRNRRAVDRGEREPDVGQYDDKRSLFSICGAAPMYRRRMLDDVALDGQVFDEDFFMYFEDLDLSWRAQLAGWRFGFVPDAIGRHERGGSGGTSSTFILACNHRNRWLVMLRNDAAMSFLRHLPGIVYTELRATLHMLGRRPAAIPLAWFQWLRLLPRQWRRRRTIQKRRQVGWRDLESSFEPYDYGPTALRRRGRQRKAIG
jgi:GT2 family glycosyltransferase